MQKLRSALLLSLLCSSFAATADVIPSRAGVYVGTVTFSVSQLSSSAVQKVKGPVTLHMAATGEYVMEGEDIVMMGEMTANIYRGVGLLSNASGGALTLQFNSNGSAKGNVVATVLQQNDDDGLVVEGKVKLKKAPIQFQP